MTTDYNMEIGLDDGDNSVTLVMNECKFLVSDKKVLKASKLLKVMLDDNPDEKVLPTGVMDDTPGRVMEYAIEFMTYFMGEGKEEPLNIPKPLFTELKTKDSWYVTFIDRVASNPDDMIDLIRLANFLDIPELLMLTAAKMATMMRGKDEQEIKNLWKIQ